MSDISKVNSVSRTGSDPVRPRLTSALTALALALLGTLALASSATAAISEEPLGRFGSGYGSEPGGPGKLELTQEIATDAATGHIYVAGCCDNNRVTEFTPWGEFVKAFGWDVALGAVNELQELRIRASAGTYKLTFNASSTPELPFDASAEKVELALNALPSIAPSGSVTVTEHIGSIDGAVPYVFRIAFHGSLGAKDVAQLEAANGTTPLAGGHPATVLEARTLAEGTPATTGLEACTTESGCKAGTEGGGAGQFRVIGGIATDTSGNLYVREYAEGNDRIQKFSPSGRFLWAIGGNVNKTKTEEGKPEAERNLCTAASGDVCQAGTVGTGNGQFKSGEGLTLANGKLYVADQGRIQIFNESGAYLGDLPDPSGALVGKTVQRVAADPSRNRLYITLGPSNTFELDGHVTVLDATTGAEVGEGVVEEQNGPLHQPHSLAVDGTGRLFAATGALGQRPAHLAEFESDGKQLLPDLAEEDACKIKIEELLGDCGLFGGPEPGLALRSVGTGPADDIYLGYAASGADSFVEIFGPPPLAFESPPPAAPSIDGQFAVAVSDTDASLRAEINPHFWSAALGTTTYYVQYATKACIETEGWAGACVKEHPAPPGAILKGPAANDDLTTSPVVLEGLTPRTDYRYRFLAEGSGAPGVLIVGVGGKVGVEGEDGFRTYASPAEEATEPCPDNERFRIGSSAKLPDCRAFEMVSPVDKEGADLKALGGEPRALEQSAPLGDRLAYGAYRAFGDAVSAPWNSQYIATRHDGEGWTSRAITPPRTKQITVSSAQIKSELRYLSPDLCAGWLQTLDDPPLAPGAIAGSPNLYRRSLCPQPGGYAALSTGEFPELTGASLKLELEGVSADGTEAVYLAGAEHTLRLYGFADGDVMPRSLCVLPGGSEVAEICTAGGPLGVLRADNSQNRINNALSADATKLYWTRENGSLYLRENPFGEGIECSGTEAPCTTAIRTTDRIRTGEATQFWGASADGSVAFYSTSKNGTSTGLFEFDAASKVSTKVAGKAAGVAAISEDASRLYFVSQEDLDVGGPAQAGQQNLYLREASGPSVRFVAALAEKDVRPAAGGKSVVATEPRFRPTRTSPDGSSLAFMSFAPLTDYDNTDLNNGETDAEVYLYRAAADEGKGKLLCVSCNPAGTRPIGANIAVNVGADFWAGASIPVAETNLHESRVLSKHGTRLYFNTSDSLARGDTNGVGDVYQWEAAGTGSCKSTGADYYPSAEGCIDLISSGQSQVDSVFTEATPDGSDVFFNTFSSLVPQDPGSADIYDARVNGGLPSPSGPSPSCEGEACQGPYVPPNDPTPASSTFQGAGNVHEAPAGSCRKGKVRKKGRCVGRHKKHKAHKRRPNTTTQGATR
jgi:hypothetical protein